MLRSQDAVGTSRTRYTRVCSSPEAKRSVKVLCVGLPGLIKSSIATCYSAHCDRGSVTNSDLCSSRIFSEYPRFATILSSTTHLVRIFKSISIANTCTRRTSRLRAAVMPCRRRSLKRWCGPICRSCVSRNKSQRNTLFYAARMPHALLKWGY